MNYIVFVKDMLENFLLGHPVAVGNNRCHKSFNSLISRYAFMSSVLL